MPEEPRRKVADFPVTMTPRTAQSRRSRPPKPSTRTRAAPRPGVEAGARGCRRGAGRRAGSHPARSEVLHFLFFLVVEVVEVVVLIVEVVFLVDGRVAGRMSAPTAEAVAGRLAHLDRLVTLR